MTVTIPDEILRNAKLDETTVLIELACHLFDKEFLTFGQAIRLSGLTRTAFEGELFARKIPAYRLELEDLESDLATLGLSKKPE